MSTTKSRKTLREPGDVPGLASFKPVPVWLSEPEPSRRFSTRNSWNWFVQQHRRELVKAGALITLAGRDEVNPPVLERMIVKIGARAAAKRCE